jgi:hypothetical protein
MLAPKDEPSAAGSDRYRTWRVMGLWNTGAEFLVTLAESARDCADRLAQALADFTQADLSALDSLWVEHWEHDEVCDEYRWMPTQELSMRRLRLQFAARRQHAMRPSA